MAHKRSLESRVQKHIRGSYRSSGAQGFRGVNFRATVPSLARTLAIAFSALHRLVVGCVHILKPLVHMLACIICKPETTVKRKMDCILPDMDISLVRLYALLLYACFCDEIRNPYLLDTDGIFCPT